jgi:hypothetical protein
MKSTPAKTSGTFLIDFATVWLVLILLPIGTLGLLAIRAVETLIDWRKPA